MIAADTSTWIAFLEGDAGEDTEILDQALQDKQVLMVPAVLIEIFERSGSAARDFGNAVRNCL